MSEKIPHICAFNCGCQVAASSTPAETLGIPRTSEERIRNRCQKACFTSPICEPGAVDACPMCKVADEFAALQAERDRLRAALKLLLADGGPLSDPISRRQAQFKARAALASQDGRTTT